MTESETKQKIGQILRNMPMAAHLCATDISDCVNSVYSMVGFTANDKTPWLDLVKKIVDAILEWLKERFGEK